MGEVANRNDWCAERLADPADDLFYAVLFSPHDQRARVRATAALFIELEAIVTRFNDMHVARTKLAWWRDELERMRNGMPTHPATRLLAEQPGNNADPALADLITGMELILLEGPATDLVTARMQAERGMARLACVLAMQAGADDTAQDATTIELGIGIGLARRLDSEDFERASHDDISQAARQLLGGNYAGARAAPQPLPVLAALAWRTASRAKASADKRRTDRGRPFTAWRAARNRLPRKMSTIRA